MEPGMSQGNHLSNKYDVTIFVACYNEEDNIIGTLETIQTAFKELPKTWEAVIVDDASKDKSVAIIQDYLTRHPELPIRLFMNPFNKGLGQNFVEAAFLGRGEFYCLIPGDNVLPKEPLLEMFRHMGEADMVIAYQDIRGRTFMRRVLSSFYTFVVNMITGYRIQYYNGMAIHRRYNVMRWHTNYHGFGFQADMIVRLLDEGFECKGVQVVTHDRQKGASSALTMRNFFSVAHTLLDLFVRRVARSRFFRRKGKPMAGPTGPIPWVPPQA
jgi:glycosyltransferase involved in cell wall biosynthesis